MWGFTFLRGRKRWLLPLSAIILLATAGGVLAAYPTSGVTVYTGCLTTGGAGSGQLSSLNASPTAPLKPCSPNETVVHLSGGTITQVSAGAGLSGGGSDGAVTLSLNANQQLPTTCSSSQILSWTGTVWGCANDQTYTAGTGLALSGNQFSINNSYRLPQTCSSGQSPFLFDPLKGTWSCFTAANAGESCASGKFVSGIDSAGDITCGTPSGGSASGPNVWVTRNLGQQSLSLNGLTTVATLSLPAGSFTLTAEATGFDSSLSTSTSINCDFDVGSGIGETTAGNTSNIDSLSVTDVVSLGSPGDVHFQCDAAQPNTSVEAVEMHATKLGTVTTQ